MGIRVSDYIINFIYNLGIKTVPFLAGGGCMYLVDSLNRSKIKPVPMLHEQSAVIFAGTYSQYTNNIGCAIVTTGPGATNAITGVASAWIDSIPIIIISGQSKTTDLIRFEHCRQKGIQHVDIVSMVKPITKYAATVMNPNDIDYYLRKAVSISTSGRKGPVWLDIPLDVQSAEIETKFDCFKVALEKSKKPVILAGNGIRLSGGVEKFIELINTIQIPTLLTWKTIDFLDENHPLNFGRPGLIAQKYANLIQQESDLLICIGTRLDNAQVAFNYEDFGNKVVLVDIDEGELSKFDFEMKFCCDAKEFIESAFTSIDCSDWISRCVELKKKYSFNNKTVVSNKINPYTFIDRLSDSLISTDIIVPDSSGSASELMCQVFKIKEGQRFICDNGLGSMGFQLPQAIGTSISSGRRVICVAGDGSIQHNLQDLQQVAGLPIKIFVFNNGGYNSIRNTQKKFFSSLLGCDSSSGLVLPSLEKLAYTYNLKYYKIYKEPYNICEIINNDGGVLCEVIVDESISTVYKVESKVINGSIISGKMGDM